jgi:hypothetical protein
MAWRYPMARAAEQLPGATPASSSPWASCSSPPATCQYGAGAGGLERAAPAVSARGTAREQAVRGRCGRVPSPFAQPLRPALC